jgi:hypothetical protein
MLRAKYSSETVLSHWNRIAPRLLCVIFVALSVWSFADDEYSTAGLQFAFSVFWLLVATRDERPTVPSRRQDS